jgi:hypothetical protein
MAERAQKRLWYKRAAHSINGETLESLLAAALAARPMVEDRILPETETAERIAINRTGKEHGLLFGQFLSFLPGMKQALITIEGGKEAYDVEVLAAAQSKDGKQREFLESVAYFGVLGDHLILVQTKPLRAREFEDYLRWFLADCAGLVPSGTMIVLQDPVAAVARSKKAGASIRGITLGTDVKAPAVADPAAAEQVVRYETSGGAWDVIKGMFGPELLKKLSLRGTLEDDNIEVKVTVRVTGRKVVSDAGQELLETLGTATRNMDERDYSIDFGRLGELKGKDLKVHTQVQVRVLESGGLADESDLAKRMGDWLRELAAKGITRE